MESTVYFTCDTYNKVAKLLNTMILIDAKHSYEVYSDKDLENVFSLWECISRSRFHYINTNKNT